MNYVYVHVNICDTQNNHYDRKTKLYVVRNSKILLTKTYGLVFKVNQSNLIFLRTNVVVINVKLLSLVYVLLCVII